MNPADIYSDLFQRVQRHFGISLKDLSTEDLAWCPVAEANSVGFLLWHLLRTWDGYLCLVDGKGETYEAENWAEKFGFDTSGRGVEGTGMGTGFNGEDVALVRPGAEQLNGFLESLLGRTRSYISTASPEDFDREVVVPWGPTSSTAGGILSHIVMHSLMHIGEAQYARGVVMRRK